MKLDKNRPYGEIFGHTESGARFTQNGVDFDVKGDPIGKIDYWALSAPELKTLVTEKGGEYTGKKEAVDWLEANA